MADEGVIISHRVLPLRRGLFCSDKISNASPEISHSKCSSPL